MWFVVSFNRWGDSIQFVHSWEILTLCCSGSQNQSNHWSVSPLGCQKLITVDAIVWVNWSKAIRMQFQTIPTKQCLINTNSWESRNISKSHALATCLNISNGDWSTPIELMMASSRGPYWSFLSSPMKANCRATFAIALPKIRISNKKSCQEYCKHIDNGDNIFSL